MHFQLNLYYTSEWFNSDPFVHHMSPDLPLMVNIECHTCILGAEHDLIFHIIQM